MSVSIIGCGWLGQALATVLLSENIPVLASYQSQATLEKINRLNIPATPLVLPLAVDINATESTSNTVGVDQALFENDVLIIAIPPQIKKGKLDYPLKIKQLVKLAELGKTQHIILLNSTAIYNGLAGAIDENSSLDIAAAKVETLLAAEQAVKEFSKQVHILRLAGLVGPNRHPGKFLQSERTFAHAGAQVNLVHQADVVNIIRLLINNNTSQSSVVYNVVSHTKINRKGYYQAAAQALGLPVPRFEPEQDEQASKQVVGDKLRADLQYDYVYDDLLQWAVEL
ncbi:MAG: SDR family NAD(P)-dependent oxidoreductase [Cognaticolwellia aestuarii]